MCKIRELGRRRTPAEVTMFRFAAILGVLALATSCATTSAPPPAAVADLAPSGKLRAGINYGNPVLVQRDSATGGPKGLAVDLAQELGRRLGVPVEWVTYDAAGKMADAVKADA